MNTSNPLHYEIKYLKGVGENRAKLLNKLGIDTIEDLLYHFPRDYIDRLEEEKISEIREGNNYSLIGEIYSVEKKMAGRNKYQLNVAITDGEDYLICTWFRFGKWFIKQFDTGKRMWVSGFVTSFGGYPQIIHPEFEILETGEGSNKFWHNRTVLPVYNLTEKISMNVMRNLILTAFHLYHEHIEESLPDYILEKFQFETKNKSLQKIHFSQHPEEIPEIRKRYAFEELFYLQLMLARSKFKHHRNDLGIRFMLNKTYTTELKKSLPFTLTSAQKRVIREIVSDMSSSRQMSRLLQGDVGSGKTIITLFAMLLAVENGYQAVLMAPTEILAEQHFRSFTDLLQNQPEIRIELLKGGNYKGKKQVKEDIAEGRVNIIIGTHALIQKDVSFARIGFVAIDEQHRFGVKQRASLSTDNDNPDLMYLSATPIPRSLALTVFGDLDISVLDELPPGRQPIKTFWKTESEKNSIYIEVRNQIKSGRQVYIVCPLIEESEKSPLTAAEAIFADVSRRIFPDFNCSLLHGKMKSREKDRIMIDFKKGKIDVLVSTTVIEVGIDVANATVMLIEHAERFGLSQLHQLRGRVGRGSKESFCYLISYPPVSREAKERLQTMCATGDGFKIAEKDLEIRGPGEFFGTEQSGLPAFKHANLVRDQKLLEQARDLAFEIIANDYDLKKDENKVISTSYGLKYENREKLFDF